MNPEALRDQVALITGAGRGIGRVIALRLARDGAAMIVAGPQSPELVQTATEIESLGRRASAVAVDVRDEDQIQAMIDKARQAFGRIDLLINNAAIIGPTAPVPNVSRADWDDVLAVNL